jgi:hypothetical protein
MIDAAQRRELAALRKQIKAIESPKWLAAKAARKAQRKASKEARAAAPMKGQRQPRVRDNAFLAFLRRQDCLQCGRTPCDPAHVRWAPPGSGWRYVGKGEKPDDYRCVPLCREHHDLQHTMHESRYWGEVLRRDPVQTCLDLYAVFLSQTCNASSRAKGGAEALADCEANQNNSDPQP